MKIALFCSARNLIPPPKTGGTEQPIFYLARELAIKGHEVVLYAARGSRVPGVTIREISPFVLGRNRKNLMAQDQLAGFFDQNALGEFFENEAGSFDIIQFNSYKFYDILPFAKLNKAPVLIRINYPYNHIYPYIKDYLKKRNNIYYLPISNFVKSLMPGLNYTDPIYPAIDMDDFTYSAKPKDYLLFIGRICHDKGVHLAIEAAKIAKKKLIIAGRIDEDAPYISYFNDIVKPQLNENIKYIGEVDFFAKVKLYQGALATLFPVLWDEPFGNIQIESMACGTPVIAFDRAACQEAIDGGVSGLLVKTGSAKEMAKAVGSLSEIDRKSVRQWTEDNFSIGKITGNYIDLYERLINDNKKYVQNTDCV